MNYAKCTVALIAIVATSGVAGWSLRSLRDDNSVSMPEYGGPLECLFSAEVTWHPETTIKGENFSLQENTWKWSFRNLSDSPIQFSIPKQKLRIDRSTHSSQFVELPDTMHVDDPITIEAGEVVTFTAESNRMSSAEGRGSWEKSKKGEYGFNVIAKIDDQYHILGCAAVASQGAKAEQDAVE